jgi:hypothetical protein
VTTLKRVLPVLDQIPAGIRQANAMATIHEHPAPFDGNRQSFIRHVMRDLKALGSLQADGRVLGHDRHCTDSTLTLLPVKKSPASWRGWSLTR